MKNYDLAKIGYDAYREFSGGFSLANPTQRIPEWSGLPDNIKDAWFAAANAVAAGMV